MLIISTKEPTLWLMAHDGAVTILFIDSRDTERNYYANQLKQFSPDYLIYHAATGKAGIAAYEAQSIDCVVLEINLSDMSGFQVLPQLVSNVRSHAATVIVLTHLTNSFIVDLAVKNGASSGLCKTFTPADVLDKHILRAISAKLKDRKSIRYEDAAPPSNRVDDLHSSLY
jgi:PleD family two-component response regulator